MSPTALMVWFIAMAVMTATVLTFATLQSAGLIGKQKDDRRPEEGAAPDAPEEPPQEEPLERRLAA